MTASNDGMAGEPMGTPPTAHAASPTQTRSRAAAIPPAANRLPPTQRRRGRAFTLTELLVVIGLIVLVVTLAIPAFSVITGGRSIDAAENQVSALVARARADALGLQEPRG